MKLIFCILTAIFFQASFSQGQSAPVVRNPAQAVATPPAAPKAAPVAAPAPVTAVPPAAAATPAVAPPPPAATASPVQTEALPLPAPAPAPVPHAAPVISEAQRKIDFAKNLVTRRQHPEINWPSYEFDVKKSFGLTAEQVAKIKTDLKYKILIHKKYCREFADFYGNEVSKEEKIKDLGGMFTMTCDSYDALLDEGKGEIEDYLTDIPNSFIINKMDLNRYLLYTSYGKKSLVRYEETEHSYQTSIFGKLGLPYKYNFMVTQALLVFSVICAGFAALKSLFG